MSKPDLPEVSQEARDRLDQIERLRSLRDMLKAGSAQIQKTCSATIFQFEKDASSLGISLEEINAALTQLERGFERVEQRTVTAQLSLIERHRN